MSWNFFAAATFRRQVLLAIAYWWSITLILVGATFLHSDTNASAATLTWDGNGSFLPSGNFNTANNWNPNTVPGSADTAQFNLRDGYTVSFPGSGTLGTTPIAYATDQLVVTTLTSVKFAEVNALSSYTVNSATIGSQSGDNAFLQSSLTGKTALSAKTATIGDAVGSQGTLTVSAGSMNVTANGPGSMGESHQFLIGGFGTGVLNITDGGVMKVTGLNGTSILGYQTSSSGTATVTGAGSTWSHTDSNSTLIVGDYGTGTLNIANGGQVDSVFNFLGLNANSTGTANIDGSGSTWSNNGAVYVGGYGTGTLNITGGGQLVSLNSGGISAGSDIAVEAGSTGTVTVTGAGSKFSAFIMTVGDSGNGTLNVLNGGQASVGPTTIANAAGSRGTLNIDGSGSKYTATADDVGENGTGTLNITNGGQLTSIGTNSIGRNSTGVGWASVDGSGSSWVNSADLVIGNLGSGILNITGSAFVSDTTGVIGSGSSSNGAVTVDGVGSHWTNSSTLSVGGGGVGTLTILNGGQVSDTTGSIGGTAVAFVTVDGVGSSWTNSSNVTVGNNGIATLTIRNEATVSVGGLLTVDTSGIVRGNSTITGNVQNDGAVAPGTLSSPGTSIGALEISGNFTQTSGGKLQMDISGTAPGSQYDQLLITGSVALDGTLQVSLVNGFAPAAGNRFDILDWSTRSGTFSSVTLPTLTGSLQWNTSQLYINGVLIVVDPNFLPGDFNRDGHVNAADILLAMAALTDLTNYQTGHGLTDPTLFSLVADVNGDGSFNNADLQYLLTTLKSGGGSADPVPEPASIALLSFGALAITIRRRSRRTAVKRTHRVDVTCPQE
jgi:T5SS/PEP-CTERM-associated repeat protein